MRVGLFLVGTFVFAAAAQGCSVKSCTLVGCQDQVSATVRRADGSFPSGMHRIEIVADSTDLTCTFTYPLGTVAGGGGAAPQCPSGLSVTVGQDQVCTQTTENGVVSYTCQPIRCRAELQRLRPERHRVRADLSPGAGHLDVELTGLTLRAEV